LSNFEEHTFDTNCRH